MELDANLRILRQICGAEAPHGLGVSLGAVPRAGYSATNCCFARCRSTLRSIPCCAEPPHNPRLVLSAQRRPACRILRSLAESFANTRLPLLLVLRQNAMPSVCYWSVGSHCAEPPRLQSGRSCDTTPQYVIVNRAYKPPNRSGCRMPPSARTAAHARNKRFLLYVLYMLRTGRRRRQPCYSVFLLK